MWKNPPGGKHEPELFETFEGEFLEECEVIAVLDVKFPQSFHSPECVFWDRTDRRVTDDEHIEAGWNRVRDGEQKRS